MIGASFQPGVDKDRERPGGQSRPPGSNQGVQEAIKVLSLRLPKVVGAQAVSPQALLSSQGSRGNPRVDSIVESVLSQMFPSGAAPSGQVPSAAPNYQPQVEQTRMDGPQLDQQRIQTRKIIDRSPSWLDKSPIPNIIVGNPPTSGTDADLSGGGTPPGMIAPLPSTPQQPGPPPDLRKHFDWLPQGPEPTPLI